MEKNQEESKKILDGKYEIISKIDEGGCGKIYKVKDINTKKIYAAKIPLRSKDESTLDNECDMLNRVKENPFIMNMIEKGEGFVSKNDLLSKNKIKYLIMDFVGKGDLSEYIFKVHKSFSEKYAKVIFTKILKGVLACHKNGICHRDLKLENILLDDQFNPIIADFGFATLTQGKDGCGKLRDFLGTPDYAAPEIFLNKEYDGVKADIFSLGVILFFIVTGKQFYKPTIQKDKKKVVFNTFYNYIECRFLKKVYEQIPEYSKEFKELWIKMVSPNPLSRISIENILKDPWLEEIRELDEEKLKELEIEICAEFLEREEKIKEFSEKIKYEKESIEEDETDSRTVTQGEHFPLCLDIKSVKNELNMKDFVKIKGSIIPFKFMNSLVNYILKHNDECSIEADEKTYKFLINYETKEEEEANNPQDQELLKKLKESNVEEGNMEKEDEDDYEKYEEMEKCDSLSIQIKLFYLDESDYIVRFMKKSGRKYDYYKNLKNIKEAIKKIL